MTISFIIEKIEKNIFLFIFLANLTITKLFGRGFLISEIFIILLIIINLIYKSDIKFLMWNIFLIMIGIILNFNNLLKIEFIKSFILILIYWNFIFLINKSNNSRECLESYLKGVNILCIFSIVQFIVRVSNIDFLIGLVNNPFGENVLAQNLKVTYFLGLPRSNSLLYEPSILGILCILGIGVCIYLKKTYIYSYNNKILILPVIGVLMSGSAIAYIALAIIILVQVLLYNKNIILKLLKIIFGIICSWIIISKISYRLNEIFIPGTSGYYRVVSPVLLIKDMFLSGKIFGIGIGNLEDYIISQNPIYMLKVGMKSKLGLTVDNAIFMIILTFGIVSIPLFIYFIFIILRRLNKVNISVVIATTFMAITTGGYNFIYFNIAIAIMILVLNDYKIINR